MPRQTTPVTIRARLSATVLDASGSKAQAAVPKLTASPSSPQITAWLNALGDITNGAVITSSATAQQYDAAADRVAFDEAYSSVITKGVLVFQNDARETRRLEVPAIDASVFGSDGKTIDPANALVVALVNATLAMYPAGFYLARGFLAGRTRKTRTSQLPPAIGEPGVGDNPPALPAEVPEP